MNTRIIQMISDREFLSIKKELNKLQTADIAEIINGMHAKYSLLVFRLLDKDMAAGVFSHLSPAKQSELSVQIQEKELRTILQDLFFDNMIDYLEEMPANVVKKILRNAGELERKLINQFLNYPDNS